MVGSAVVQQIGRWGWLPGALVMPGLFPGWQWTMAGRDPRPIRATGAMGHVLPRGAFLVL